jgi:hypothetical protein
MPKGVNKDGTPKVRPPGAGRKVKDGVHMSFKFARDVAEILATVKNRTGHIEKLVRKDHKRNA